MSNQEFVKQLAVLVQKYAPKYNIDVCSPIIAQACLESGFGTSNLSKNHNYFGLTYRENRVKAASGFVQTVKGNKFFKFASMEKGVEGYFQFINISNYAKLKEAKTPEEYLKYIIEAKYATDSKYIEKCMSIVDKYNLTSYDKKKVVTTESSFDQQAPGDLYRIKVAIDAGHGSNTPGKRHPDGYKGHFSNVKIAYYLDQILRKNNIDTFKVSWDDNNSENDNDIPLTTRQNMIKNAKCNYLISIHANAHGSGTVYTAAEGIETFYHSDKALSKSSSKDLAEAVHKHLIKGTAQKNRGVKTAEFAMCNAVACGVDAAILIETAFMTNQKESELLKSDEFCFECAVEIASGLFEFLGYKNKPNTSGIVVNESKPVNKQENVEAFSAGARFTTPGIDFYKSSTDKQPVAKKSGTFYIWSEEIKNGRVRITNAPNKVGVAGQVTAWVNREDINL